MTRPFVLTGGEFWPIHVAWLREHLRWGFMTRAEISKRSGVKRWRVDSDVRDARDLGLVTTWSEKGPRGGKHLVRLVVPMEEKR